MLKENMKIKNIDNILNKLLQLLRGGQLKQELGDEGWELGDKGWKLGDKGVGAGRRGGGRRGDGRINSLGRRNDGRW